MITLSRHLWQFSLAALCVLVGHAIAADTERKYFDIPAGPAEKTLRIFTEQCGRQVGFPTAIAEGVRTNPVKGEFAPDDAADRLLAGTSLKLVRDEQSGAFSVVRSTPPEKNGARAARTVANSATVPTQSQLRANDSNLSEEAVMLSPFLVSSEGDEGYRAANTLSGTRMNSSLFQTPAAISVLTKQLLDDIGAENTEQFINFAVNAGRSFGNDPTGLTAQQFDLDIKVRGFTGVQVTRDYFPLGTLSSDRYNVERVDLNRGPNSILYGIGGPGGVINTSTKQALLGGTQKSVSVSVGSYDKRRSEVDFAFPLWRDKLALRLNGLLEERNGWRDFEHLKQKAIAVAGTYKPFKQTWVRANFENNDRDQNVPFVWPAKNYGATSWLAAGKPMAPNPLLPATNPSPATLRSRNQLPVIWSPQLRTQPFRISGTSVDMRPDLPGTQASGYWETVPGPASPSVAGIVDDINFKTVPDNANLMGPGNTADQNYYAGTILVEQRYGDFFIELGYNRREWYRESRFALLWSQNGVIGDANPVLPGAYYADGSADIRTGALGTLLPDIAAANPMAGGLYVESQASYRYLTGGEEHYRASLAYELDLTKRRQWLGRHSVAGVVQSNRGWSATQVQREYNLTPQNRDPIDATQNQIVRRTYLDFHSPGGLRGAMDPWSNPIPTSTGVTAGFVSPSPSSLRKTNEDSAMVALQSRFLGDRLVLTGGYRRDEQRSNLATIGAERLPNSTNLWSKQADRFDPALESKFFGTTKTLGSVISPKKWLGFTFNMSDSVQPQAQYDMFGKPIGTRRGEGKDYGVRLNLLDGRLYLSANAYSTDDVNQFYSAAIITTQVVQTVNSMLETLIVAREPLPKRFADARLDSWWPSGLDRVNNTGSGVEFELVGKLTKQWSLSLNYSRSNLKVSDVASDLDQFMQDVQSSWQNSAKPLYQTPSSVASYVTTRDRSSGRDFTAFPATFNDAYETVMAVLNATKKQNGQSPLLHVRDSLNFLTSYRFDNQAPRWLRRARIGIGGNYRGPAVIGYGDTGGSEPFKGVSNFTASLMLGKTFAFKERRTFDVQLNVFNLLAEEELLPYAATSTGEVVRWMYPRTRRSFDLRAVYSF